jgi:hypothetical protein
MLMAALRESGLVATAGVVGGVPASAPTAADGDRDNERLKDELPRLATIIAVARADIVPTVSGKNTLLAPEGTVTEAGMVIFAELVPS